MLLDYFNVKGTVMATKLTDRPINDWLFKRIFGDGRNSDYLKGFLVAALGYSRDELENIQILNPYTAKDHPDDKFGILDVKVRIASGEMINLEVQIVPDPGLTSRVVYYLSDMVSRQLSSGESFDDLNKSICICIVDHTMHEGSDDYHSVFQFRDTENGVCLSDRIEAHTLELTKLPARDDGNPLWPWLSYFKSQTLEDLEAAATHCEEVGKVVSAFKRVTADEMERERQHKIAMGKSTHATRVAHARREGAHEIAKKFLAMGMPIEQVAEGTGLSVEEIESLSAA